MDLDFLIHQYLSYHLGTNLILITLFFLFVKRYIKNFVFPEISPLNFLKIINDFLKLCIVAIFLFTDIAQPFNCPILEVFYFLFSFGIFIAILTINFRK